MRRLAFQTMSNRSPATGDGADEDADGEIDGHADEGDEGDAADPGGDGNDQREQAAEDVANAGDEADDAVDAETEAGAGNAKELVENELDGAKGLVAKEPRAALPAIVRWRQGIAGKGLARVCRGGKLGHRKASHGYVAAGGRAYPYKLIRWYNQGVYGGYSSAAERLTVAQDVVGSIPTSRPN